MFSNDRKTIGVFAEALQNEFTNRLCRGIAVEGEKRGYNIAFFATFGNYGQNERYYQGDCELHNLPAYEELDGVILALDTMQDLGTRAALLKQVKERCHCPIVSAREMVEGVNNLLVDNTTCMEGIIRHFVEDHGFTRLCFMTGPADHWDAVERLDCFKRMMKEYGIPIGERQTMYGDFWKNKGEEACDWFLGGGEMPQAIVCANDYMAIAVASELIHRGIRVPEDICVSGYDGVRDTMEFTPAITTSKVPFLKMGRKAVAIIDEKQDCPEKADDYFFGADVIRRESCGCVKKEGFDVIETRRNTHEEEQVRENRRMQFNFLSIQLGECHTFEELPDILFYSIFNIEGFRDYCLCVCENLNEREDFSTYTDTMEVRVHFKDRQNRGSVRIPYDRKNLLPAEATDEQPQLWYFSPLHFQNRTFGYEAFRFWLEQDKARLHLDWNIITSNKIQDILVHHKLQELIVKLENMYDRDALTGMYNRRGWETRGGQIFEQAKAGGQNVFLAIIDLDGMKQINDNHGHVEGDHALQVVCQAIQCSCSGDNINARTGGDEFVVIARDIDESEGKGWMESLAAYLDTYNQNGSKAYDIHASYGYVCRVPDGEDSIETYTKESDEIMYRNKIENKRRRNEPLR